MTFRREFRPIDEWPWPRTPDDGRQRSRFETAYSDTMELLDRELSHLDPEIVYLCLDLPESQILQDRSGPYKTARPDFPGVLLVVEGTEHGTLRYGTDQFDGFGTGQPSWQHNLRAIALGLEALRKVDRYGITRGGQQYRGFAALPAPGMTPDDARQFLIEVTGLTAGDDIGRQLILAARKACHPDAPNGSEERWREMLDALRVLGFD